MTPDAHVSAWSGVLGFLAMGGILWLLYRFIEWADPDPDWEDE